MPKRGRVHRIPSTGSLNVAPEAKEKLAKGIASVRRYEEEVCCKPFSQAFATWADQSKGFHVRV